MAPKLKNSNNSTLISPIHTFPWRETKIFKRQVKVKKARSTLFILSSKEKCQLWQEINSSPSISSNIDRVFSTFRRKKYGYNPSEMDNKVVIPAPTQ